VKQFQPFIVPGDQITTRENPTVNVVIDAIEVALSPTSRVAQLAQLVRGAHVAQLVRVARVAQLVRGARVAHVSNVIDVVGVIGVLLPRVVVRQLIQIVAPGLSAPCDMWGEGTPRVTVGGVM